MSNVTGWIFKGAWPTPFPMMGKGVLRVVRLMFPGHILIIQAGENRIQKPYVADAMREAAGKNTFANCFFNVE